MILDATKVYTCLTKQVFSFGDYSLATIQPEDIEDIRQWRNGQMEVLRQSAQISFEQQVAYYQRSIWPTMGDSAPANILLTFFWKGERIAYGGFVHIDWSNSTAEVSFLCGIKIVNDQERYTTIFSAFLESIKHVAAKDLDFKCLYSETYSFRTFHLSILEKNGFLMYGIKRNAVWVDDSQFDSLLHQYIIC